MSEDSTLPTDDYPLGRTSEEYQRLRHQAKVWEAATKRILQQVGLQEGMSSLDIGCGPGEVMRLMGEVVGTTGQVTGLDTDGDLGRQAIEMLRATTDSNFSFLEMDFETAEEAPDQLFDFTYARLMLYLARDPLVVLRKMEAWTKPGGYIVIQDYDVSAMNIYPRLASWGEFEKVVIGVFKQSGKDIRIGHKLPTYFADAGLGDPDGTDVSGVIGSLEQYGGMVRGVYQSLLPRALQTGLTTEAESQAFLGELSEAEKRERYYSVFPPLMIGVWKRKSL